METKNSLNQKMKNKFFKIVLVLFMLLTSFSLFSQNDNLPANKYKTGHTLSDIFKKPKGLVKYSLTYGYHQTNFLNPTYALNTKNGTISRKYGGVLKFQWILYPFLIDIDWFSSRYRVKNVYSISDTTNIRHHGFSMFLSTTFPPIIRSSIFIPYLGIGYQFSSIGTANEIIRLNGNSKGVTKTNFNTSSPMWKLGFSLKIYGLTLGIEHRQTLTLNSNESYGQFAVLLGYNFNRL